MLDEKKEGFEFACAPSNLAEYEFGNTLAGAVSLSLLQEEKTVMAAMAAKAKNLFMMSESMFCFWKWVMCSLKARQR